MLHRSYKISTSKFSIEVFRIVNLSMSPQFTFPMRSNENEEQPQKQMNVSRWYRLNSTSSQWVALLRSVARRIVTVFVHGRVFATLNQTSRWQVEGNIAIRHRFAVMRTTITGQFRAHSVLIFFLIRLHSIPERADDISYSTE